MTGNAVVSMMRRGCTFFATVFVLLVLGERLEMLRTPSDGGSATLDHADVKAVANHKRCFAVVYADAQQRWAERSAETEAETGLTESFDSVGGRGRARGRSMSGAGKNTGPFYKRYTKQLVMAFAALAGLLVLASGYKYWKGQPGEGQGHESSAEGGGGPGPGNPATPHRVETPTRRRMEAAAVCMEAAACG